MTRRLVAATPSELSARLPGDDLIAEPTARNTRAITIDASTYDIWPWVAQIGADRGGFYSYDWLENLFGLGVHSAYRVVDDWQELRPGDMVYATRRRSGGWLVDEVRPGQALVLQLADLRQGRPARRTDPDGWEFVWSFVLEPQEDGTTRLLVRESIAVDHLWLRLLMALVRPVSFVMTRRMLLGIKARTEFPEAALRHHVIRTAH